MMINKKHTSITLILPETPILLFGSTSTKQKSQIEVCYTVKTHLHYRDEPSTSLFGNRMVASKTIRELVQDLLEQDTIIPVGTTFIDFEVYIPSHSLPSFESKYCDIQHKILAKLLSHSKVLLPISNQTIVEKCFQAKKTIIPKEVSVGILSSVVPKLAITGERANLIQWQFRVPTWACLQQGNIEFEGFFYMLIPSATLNKIQVDVIQEELYFYDSSCTDMKRRPVTNTTIPSTYIKPPSGSIISFSIPFSSNEKKSEFIWLLEDSPFSRASHFIRVVLHTNNGKSICVDLPIQVTPQIEAPECNEYLQLNDEARDDILPTYDNVISQGEKLPEYKSRRKYLHSQQRVYNNNSNNSSSIDINDTVQHIIKRGSYQQSVSDTYKHLSTHFAQQPLIAEIKVAERSLKEFCAIS